MKSASHLLPLTPGEFVARAAAHSGGVCCFIRETEDMPAQARDLEVELEFVAERPVALISVAEGAEPTLAALDSAGDVVALLFGFSELDRDEWAGIDQMRNRLQHPAGLVLLMAPRDLERLQAYAPNLSSWLGGRVWRWSDEIPDAPAVDVEQRLSTLRRHFGKTDEEVLAAARDRTLPLDPEYAEWLILLGQGNLLV